MSAKPRTCVAVRDHEALLQACGALVLSQDVSSSALGRMFEPWRHVEHVVPSRPAQEGDETAAVSPPLGDLWSPVVRSAAQRWSTSMTAVSTPSTSPWFSSVGGAGLPPRPAEPAVASLRHIAWDLSQVSDIDARGVGALADAARKARDRGVQVSVTAASAVVHRLATLAKLDTVIPGDWNTRRSAEPGCSADHHSWSM